MSYTGITQKYLIVTSNYHARQRGVTKLSSINDAKVIAATELFDLNLATASLVAMC